MRVKGSCSLDLQLRVAHLPSPETEYRFAPPRRWRFDYAWPSKRLAIEQEGAVWTRGRHTRGKGYVADMEKYNAATLLGWRVLRFTPQQIADGTALEQIHQAWQG